MKAGWNRVLIGVAVVATLLGAGTVITLADTGGVIFACVNNSNGSVRIVAAQVSCKPNETAAHWNVIGPAGPPGPQGPAGPAGAQGPPGESGPHQQVVGVVSVDDAGIILRTEAIQFSSGVSATVATGGGGVGAGHPVLGPAGFTKVIDHVSVDLLKVFGQARQVKIKVELCTSIPTPTPHCSGAPSATYLYEHALLTKIETTSNPLFMNTLEENVGFAYTKLTLTKDGSSVSLT